MLTKAQKAGYKAAATKRSAPYKARKTTLASQAALREWALENGWYIVFLDAKSGSPRTGIVDALLVRVGKRDADALDLRLVQLKTGSGALKAADRRRLFEACEKVRVAAGFAFFDHAIDVDLREPAPVAKKAGKKR